MDESRMGVAGHTSYIFVRRLNQGWGKVATFGARGEKVNIEIKTPR